MSSESEVVQDVRQTFLKWSILGFIAMNVIVAAVLPMVVSGGYSLDDPVLVASLISFPAYVVLLMWIRAGREKLAAEGFVLTTFAAALLFTVALQETRYEVGDYGYLATVVLFAAFFLGPRRTAAYAVASVVALLVVFAIWPFSLQDLTLSLSFLVVFSGMLVLTSALMDRDSRALRQAADAMQAASQGLRSANEKLTTIFSHTDQALLLLGRDGVVQVANPRSAELLGLAGGSPPVPGERLVDIVPGEARVLSEQAAATARGGGQGMFRVEIRDRHFEAQIVPTGDGLLVLGRDVTAEVERQQEEDARRDSEARLARLELVARMQRNFMNIATHELQIPLTPVRLQLHVLRDRQTGPLNSAQLHSIEIIERNALRLSALVDEMLDVVRIETSRLMVNLGDVEIVALTRQELERMEPVASMKGISLDYRGPATMWVRADARRLERVIRALLDNAIKFGHAGGFVRVEITAADMVRWRITDDGIGFDPARGERLFQPFTQLHEATEAYGGSGLGLAISRGYIEAQGGRIEAHSEGIDRGSTFSFWLPVALKTVEH